MSGEPEITRTPEEEEVEDEIKSSYKPPPEKTIEEILAADQDDESLRKYKEALLGQAQAGAVVVDTNDPRKVIVKKLALCVVGRDDVELDLSGDLTDLKKQMCKGKEIESQPGRYLGHTFLHICFDNRSTHRTPTMFLIYIKDLCGMNVNNAKIFSYADKTAIVFAGTSKLPWGTPNVFTIKEGVQYRIRIDFIVQREIVHGLKYVQKTYRLGVPVDKMTHMVGSYPPKTEIQSYTTPPEDAPSGLMARGSYSVNSLFTDDDKNIHLQWEWCFDIKKDWKD